MSLEHHHDHPHDGDGRKTLGERNKEHFDEAAPTAFSEPWIQKIGEQCTNELQRGFTWMQVQGTSNSDSKSSSDSPEDGVHISMLDYACGNGMVSRALAPFVSTIRGMDLSAGMVSQYNLEAAKAGYSRDQMHAMEGDVVTGAVSSGSEDPSSPVVYDLIVMSLALHHIEDPPSLVSALSQLLRPGTGVLVILDSMEDEKEENNEESGSDNKTDVPALLKDLVSRNGFKEAEMRDMFDKAGLKGWKWRLFAEKSVVPMAKNGEVRGFMARGHRSV